MEERSKGNRRCREAVGQKDVPLCDIIGAKLKEYSDGQILKELLQNAEDAGATELTLTIDCRTFPRASILREGEGKWNEDFEVCQGPALLAWNNSTFMKKDWDSIQLPMRSMKKLDPDTIGKFGLGFLSVYHLTDYPWIVSGNRIMIMDTQKTGIFRGEGGEKSEGTDFFLEEDWAEIKSLHDQFAPFQSLHLRQDSDVEGTFFRLPLRTVPSKISSSIYTTGDDSNAISLRSLFKAFVEGEEGETLLLFLRSVRKVTLMIHQVNDDVPKLLYQVSMSDSNGISRTKVVNGSETTLTNWRIQHMLGNRQKKSTLSLAARMFDNYDDPEHNGYTFCFLPMPFVEENSTGLSFHVHGDFSLSENRRSILWPSADNQHNIEANYFGHPTPRSEWLTATDAVFTTEVVAEEFDKFFGLARLPVVSYANGTFLRDYELINKTQLIILSPKLFASFMRSHWANYLNQFSISESIIFLKYIMSTGTLSDIEGLRLLPRLDGSLELFKKPQKGVPVIFATNSSIPRSIFRGLDACFLHLEAESCLSKIISDGGSQLKRVGFTDIPALVKKVLTADSNTDMNNYIKELYNRWLPASFQCKYFRLWIFLNGSTNDISLNVMENLDILPLRQKVVSKPYSGMQKKGLATLKSGCVFLTDRNLSSAECELLEVDLGLLLIKHHPFLDHPKASNYLLDAKTGDNILNALHTRLQHEKIQLEDLHFSKQTLSFLLPKLSIASRHLDILGNLKLFHQHGSADMISAAAANRLYISERWSNRIMGIDGLPKVVVLAQNDLDRQKISRIVGARVKSPLDILTELKLKLSSNEAAVIRTIFAWPQIELQRLSSAMQDLDLYAIARQLKQLFIHDQLDSVVVMNMMEFLADFDPKPWVTELTGNIPCANSGHHSPSSLVLKTAIQHCPLLCHPHPQLNMKFLKRIGVQEQFVSVQSGVSFLTALAGIQHGKPLNDDDLNSTIQILTDIEKSIETRVDVDPNLLLPDEKSILRPLQSLAYHCDENSLGNHYAVHRRIYPDMARKFGIAVERDLLLNTYEHDDEESGSEFGQELDLVQRIHRLIEQYHAPNDFIQEFVQNAEDARATTMAFIVDERVHTPEHLATSQLAPLQGPALLIYNNAIFTSEDLTGIQKLGIGSKGDDRQKIGRFGSGFNCAYAYTDCPSFISNDSVICFLDPMRQFVAFNPAKRPGRRFTVDGGFKHHFNGSYESFQMPMGLEIALQGGTMFRLPLRTQSSDIWHQVFSTGSIIDTLKAAGNDAMRMLLFLSNVRQINAYHITNSGEVVPLWESAVSNRSDMTEKNDVSLVKFHETLRLSVAIGLDPVRMPLSKNTTKSLISSKSYVDKTETSEQWIISTRLGFESLEFLNNRQEFLDIKLLPLGSVAKLILCNGKPVEECPDQVFVSLPLPARTGLPVSLHGQFCLDSEGRKNFWTSSSNESNDRKIWNQAILSGVLALAYIDLLEHLTSLVNRKTEDNLLVSLDMFWKTFPNRRHVKTEEWREFGESVYKAAVERCSTIIPNADMIGWIAPGETSGEDTLFTNVCKIPRTMFNFFVQIGMPLPQECPLYVVDQFVDLGCKTVSPNDVIEALRIEPERVCLQGYQLPSHISNTKFYCDTRQDAAKAQTNGNECITVRTAVELAKDIFSYIVDSSATDQPKISLSGIPLLITHDRIVQKFHDNIFDPHTQNNYSIASLFPSSQDKFALRFIAENWKADRVEEEFLVKVKPDDVPALLDKSFPGLRQQEQDDYQLLQDSCLSGNADEGWLRKFWSVMLDICDADDMRSQMEPIADWNLVPTKIIGNASVYLFSLASQDRLLSYKLKHGLGELPDEIPYEQGFLYSHKDHTNNLERFLEGVCVNSAVGLVHVLDFWEDSLEWSQGSSRVIREYLNSMLAHLYAAEKTIIKQIPIFRNESGSLVSIYQKEALFRRLHSGVPKRGVEFWSCGEVLFVKRDTRITKLYKWLGIRGMDDLMLVQRFVIPALPQMEPQDQVQHLEFIRYMSECSTNPDWDEPKEMLAETPFVLGERLISEFFNHEVELFKLMEDDKHFLPLELVTALNKHMRGDWPSFLETLGFAASVSGEHLQSYATKMSKTHEIDLKYRVVLRSLCDLEHSQNSSYFASLCGSIFSIAFVPSGVLEDEYQQLFPVSRPRQLIKINESSPFSERTLIWSRRLFLPKWTNNGAIGYLLQKYSSFKLDFDDVVLHASTVLSRLKSAKDTERTHNGINSKGCIKTLQSYIIELYEYLQLSSHSGNLNSVIQKLQKIPLIPVENGTRLMVPTMVVRKLESDIPPFLYALPEDLKPYKKLLEQNGMTKLPETRHFTSVLESFYQTSQKFDNPNVRNGIQSAQNGIVDLGTQNWEKSEKIILLSIKNTLMISCDLIFRDDGQLQAAGDTLSYWSHPECEIKRLREFIDTMPRHLKPQNYSGMIERVLDTDQTEACPLELCQTSANLELLLKSDQFWMALQRIYYKDQGQMGPMSAWEQGQEFLNSLTVKCCERIVIVEKMSGQSVAVVPKKVFTTAKTIYIYHAATSSSKVLVTIGIAEFLEKALPLRNCDNSTVLLLPLLECTPNEIGQFLADAEVPNLPGPRASYGQHTPRRNPTLGKKYFAQAEENLKTAQNMGDDCGNDSVVYMVHQAIELALKGLIISETGINVHSHYCLYSLASEASGLRGLDPTMQRYVLELINECNTEYIRMRYPNDCLDIPHRMYTEIHRENALDYGIKIMDQLRHL